MKPLQKFLAALVLTSTLSIAAMAGDIGTGVIQQPPPPSMTGEMSTGNSATSQSTATGEIGTGVASTLDPVTETVLSLLQGVLALF